MGRSRRPPCFRCPKKTLILLGLSIFSYGSALERVGPYRGPGAEVADKYAPAHTGTVLAAVKISVFNRSVGNPLFAFYQRF